MSNPESVPARSGPPDDAYIRALWRVVGGYSFHDDECPAIANDADDACNCGYRQAMEAVRVARLEADRRPRRRALAASGSPTPTEDVATRGRRAMFSNITDAVCIDGPNCSCSDIHPDASRGAQPGGGDPE